MLVMAAITEVTLIMAITIDDITIEVVTVLNVADYIKKCR